jgi:Skp family chaperone for outer membrane proteins
VQLRRLAVIPGRAIARVAFAVVGCATTSPAPPRPAVVDLKRAAMECRAGRAARAELDEKMQAFLDEAQPRVVELLNQARAAGARGDDPREAMAKGQREAARITAEIMQHKKELRAEEERRTALIYARLRAALPGLAQAHHATITESSGLPAGTGVLDLTPDLIRAVDAQPPLPVGPGR